MGVVPSGGLVALERASCQSCAGGRQAALVLQACWQRAGGWGSRRWGLGPHVCRTAQSKRRPLPRVSRSPDSGMRSNGCACRDLETGTDGRVARTAPWARVATLRDDGIATVMWSMPRVVCFDVRTLVD